MGYIGAPISDRYRADQMTHSPHHSCPSTYTYVCDPEAPGVVLALGLMYSSFSIQGAPSQAAGLDALHRIVRLLESEEAFDRSAVAGTRAAPFGFANFSPEFPFPDLGGATQPHVVVAM